MMGELSKKEHRRRLKLYDPALTLGENAKRMRLTYPCIRQWANNHNIERHGQGRPGGDFPEREELYDAGLCDSCMAKELGLYSRLIQSWRARRGYGSNKDFCPGCAAKKMGA